MEYTNRPTNNWSWKNWCHPSREGDRGLGDIPQANPPCQKSNVKSNTPVNDQ